MNPIGTGDDAGGKYVRPLRRRLVSDATLGLNAIPIECVHDIEFSFWIEMCRGVYYCVSH